MKTKTKMITIKLSKMDQARLIVNHLMDRGVIEHIIRSKDYDVRYTNISGSLIADFIFKDKLCPTPEVKLYRPKMGRFSKAMAKAKVGHTETVWLNKYKINRSVGSLCGSIAHEWGHTAQYAVKAVHPTVYFHHGDNKRAGKENTMQYWLGTQVKYYVERNYDAIIRDIGII